MRVPFTKMQGLGNDFVLLDARFGAIDLSTAQRARLADRRYGVGCDQILLIDQPQLPGADVRYRVFNADGSAAEHCGNGVRCVAHYLAEHDAVSDGRLTVELNGQGYALELAPDGMVKVDMGEPDFAPAALPLTVAAQALRYRLPDDTTERWFGAVSMG